MGIKENQDSLHSSSSSFFFQPLDIHHNNASSLAIPIDRVLINRRSRGDILRFMLTQILLRIALAHQNRCSKQSSWSYFMITSRDGIYSYLHIIAPPYDTKLYNNQPSAGNNSDNNHTSMANLRSNQKK